MAIVIPTTLPAAIAVPGDIRQALPTLTVMLASGAKDLIIAILILIGGWLAARWAGRWLRDVTRHSHYVDDTLKPLISNGVRYLILAVTLVVVLGQFGVQTTSLIAILGATGLAIGLALQGTLSNVASGVMLLFLRPFRVFDRVKLSDITGMVREIGLFRTEIVTDNGNFVSVPNATIFSGTIVNLSREETRRTDFTVEVDRDENLDRVQKTVLDALTAEKCVLKTPAPSVEIATLGPISTTLSVQVWLDNRGFGSALSDVKKCVRTALQQGDVAAPVPVAAPAVAPWQPPPDEDPADGRAKPN